MQRITDIWRNLVRYPGRHDDTAAENHEHEEESDDRELEINETYRNQFWTRIVSVQQGPTQEIARHPLAADIIESLTEIEGMEDREDEDALPNFDPAEFVQRHPTPTVTEFALGEDRLRELAM